MPTNVQGAQWLEDAAARVWFEFRDDLYARTGIWPRITAPYGAGRTYYEQLMLWLKNPGLAWHPNDPRANHMKGKAWDLDNWMQFPAGVLQEVLNKYGVTRPIAHERWHCDATGAYIPGGVAGRNPIELPVTEPAPVPIPIQEEDDMRFFAIEGTSKGTVFYKYSIDDAAGISQDEASAHKRQNGNREDTFPRVSGAEATQILNGVKFMRSRRLTQIANRTASEVSKDLDDLVSEIARIAPASTT